jgi:hypothetical protein
VDEGALLHPLAPRELDQRLEVIDVRVDAAVRDEPEQVDVAAPLTRAPEGAEERLIFEERPTRDRPVDAL